MVKKRKMWVYSPGKAARSTVPEEVKAQVEAKARELVEAVLKPQHVKPPKDGRFNYLIDISTRWHRSYFYFVSTYASTGPNALSPTFEAKFARLEHVGGGRFNLAYMRHTGQWWPVGTGLPLDRCLTAIRDDPIFTP
jgi:hypothetical protein